MLKKMKRYFAVILAITFVISLFPSKVSAASMLSIKVSGNTYYDYAFQVLDLVNEERAKNGLSALTMDTDMLSAAMKRAAETNVYFSHTRPDGSDCFTAFPDGLSSVGENIAAGQTTPEAVMNSWMNSSGHRANILNSSYNVIGIGCYKAGDSYYWVQTFGKSSSADKAKKSNYADGKKNYKINAKASYVSLEVTLTKKSIKKGATGKLKVKLTNLGFPYDVITLPNSQFTFISSNKKIAKVDSKGVITGVKKGSAKIKVKFTSGGTKAGKTVTVTVK